MRPQPPSSLFEDFNSSAFIPAEDMPECLETTFLDPAPPLHSEEHAHLAQPQSLACFDTPSIVVDTVMQEFGETITRQSVEGYDPTKRAGSNLAEKWRLLFEETRKTAPIAGTRRTLDSYLLRTSAPRVPASSFTPAMRSASRKCRS
ncbi:DUF2280 domain-containing protein [Sinorhizobium meliloti]|nr:DUF2280 domain-containing protein [Sinorhizobium meliloti]